MCECTIYWMELEAALPEMPVLNIGEIFVPASPASVNCNCFGDDCTLTLSLEIT